MGPLWPEAFRYHIWANLHLLDVCARLTKEQLELTAAGTYGTLAATLQHLVAAEQRYIRRMGGEGAQLNEGDDFPGIDTLKRLVERGGDQLIEAAARITGDDVVEAKFHNEAFRMHLGVVLIQALHHGNDHRTHACTILGSHDISYGDMDVWAYGQATGALIPVPAGA